MGPNVVFPLAVEESPVGNKKIPVPQLQSQPQAWEFGFRRGRKDPVSVSGTNCPGDSHAWELWEQRVWTIHLTNDCKYLCFSDTALSCIKMGKASEGRNERDKTSLAEAPTSPLSQPSPYFLLGASGPPIPQGGAKASGECAVPKEPMDPHPGTRMLPTTSCQRYLCCPLSFSWSCYLNGTGFQGEGQQPPRRALPSDGLWGQTGWRPPFVIDGEEELKVRMAPINGLAWCI